MNSFYGLQAPAWGGGKKHADNRNLCTSYSNDTDKLLRLGVPSSFSIAQAKLILFEAHFNQAILISQYCNIDETCAARVQTLPSETFLNGSANGRLVASL